MANLRLVGAVGIKVRPDTDGFRKETQRGINEELGPHGEKLDNKIKVDVKVDADTKKAEEKIESVRHKLDGKKINLEIGVDYDSLKKAEAQLDQALKRMRNTIKPISLDPESLKRELAEIREKIKNAKVEIKFAKDEAGYQSVLDKIREIKREKIVTQWSFNTDNASLQRAERRAKAALDRIEARKTISIGYQSRNFDSIQNAISQVDKLIAKKREVKINTKLDLDSLNATKAKLEERLKNAEVKMRIPKDEAGFKSVLAKIEEIRRKASEIPFNFKTDEASLKRAEERAQAALAKIDANKTIDIRYTNSYDGIRSAIAEVDKRLEDVRKLKLETKLDEASLAATKAELQRQLDAGAKVQVDFVDDLEGYKAVLARIKEIQRQKATVQIEFQTDDASLAAEAAHYEALIAQHTPKAQVTFTYNNNYESLKETIAKIDAELEKIQAVKLPVDVDQADLLRARANIHALLNSAPFELEITADKAGYALALKKIRELQAQKIQLSFQTDSASLAAEAAKYEALLAGLQDKAKIKLTMDGDTLQLRESMRKVNEAIHDLGKIEADVEVNPLDLTMARANIEAALGNSKFEIGVDVDSTQSLTAMRSKLEAMLSENHEIKIPVDASEASIREAMGKIDRFKKDAEDKKIKMEVESVGLLAAAARLKVFSRARTIPFYVRISEKSLLVAEGILKSLSGYNTLTSLGRQFENLFTKFDTASLKISTIATGIGSVVNSLSYATTALFTIGDGVVDSLGLIAAAPAMLLAGASAIFIFRSAFENFADSFSTDTKKAAKAYAALSPVAKKTVDELRGTYTDLRKPIQDAFWTKMGPSMAEAFKHLFPVIKQGLLDSSTELGAFTEGVLKAFNRISLNGDLKQIFANLKGFFHNLSAASDPFFEGFNRFGLKGSELLPRFGNWLADMARRFNDLSKKTDVGKLIDNAVASLKDMWNIGASVIDMFRGLTHAIDTAGGRSLHEFSQTMRGIADMMLAEPFHSRMANIFRGAREGASLLNDGFQDLAKSIGNSSGFFATLLTQLGSLGGKLLTNISVTIDTGQFKAGILDVLRGLDEMLHELKPAFESLGRIVGGLGTIAGGVFKNLGPLITTIVGLIDTLVTTLSGNLAGVAMTFIETLNDRFVALQPTVSLVADALNAILGAFNSMPEPIKLAVTAFGIFVLMRSQVAKLFEAIASTKPFQALRDNWRVAESEAGRYGTSAERQFRLTTALAEGAGRGLRGMADNFSNFVQRVQTSATPVRTALGGMLNAGGSGLAKGFSGLMNVLGGPWGLALAAGTIAVTAFGDAQEKARKNVDDLAGSLDKQSGKVTAATREIAAGQWMQIKTNGWDDFWRGFILHSQAANETVSKLGISAKSVTDKIIAGGPTYDKWIANLKLIRDNLNGEDTNADGSFVVRQTKSFEELSRITGFTVDQIKSMDRSSLDNLITQTETTHNNLAKARDEVQKMSEATGLGIGTTKRLADAIDDMGREGATTADKIKDIKTQLDILHGNSLSKDDAAREFAKAWDSAMEEIDNATISIDENGNKIRHSMDGLVDAQGKIQNFHGAGGQLYDSAKSVSDALLGLGQSAYQNAVDDGKTADYATQKALDAMKLTPEQLKDFSDRTGLTLEKTKALLNGFFGEEWELRAIFSGDGKKFFEAKKAAEDAGVAFTNEFFQAYLAANPDNVVGNVDFAKKKAQEFSDAQYEAILKGMPKQALDAIAQAVGAGDAYKKGDYSALVKALDSTGPGVLAALLNIRSVTGGNYEAVMKALMNELMLADVKARLDEAASPRNVKFNVTYDDLARDAAAASRGGARFGAIVRAGMSPFGGAFPMEKFADGGFSHIAQIARSRPGTVRVWAEPETGGEAYIPLGVSKRSRSTAILSQVAQMFGYTLTRGQQFVNGGITAPVTNNHGGTHINIDAGPGVAYQYAEAVADRMWVKARDAAAVYDLHTI